MMKDLKWVNEKQHDFYYKNALKKKVAYFLWVVFAICLIGFIVTSFGDIDLKINEMTEPLMYIGFFKVWQLLVEEFGLFFPIWIGFIVFQIILESYHIRLRNNYFIEGKIISFLKRKFIFVIIGFYFLWFTIRAYMFYANFEYKRNLDMGWGVGNDVKSQLPMTYRLWIIGCAYLIEILLSVLLIIIFRISSFKTKLLLKTSAWYQATKIGIYYLLSYLMIWFFKHLFGRPYYFSVVYDQMYNDMINAGWQPSVNPAAWKWPELNNLPQFTRWYVPNNILLNLKYWFTFPPHSDPNNDQWWNMDFPSGHTTAVSLLVSMISFLWSINKSKIKKSHFNLIFLIMIIFWVNMMFTMVYSRFHWASDVLFSSIYGVVAWKWANKLTEIIVIPILLHVNKVHTNQQTTGFLVENSTKDQVLIAMYYHYEIVIFKKIRHSKKNQQIIEKCIAKYKIKILDNLSIKEVRDADAINYKLEHIKSSKRQQMK